MIRRFGWALFAAAAACGAATGGVGLQMHAPRALVRFAGVTSASPGTVRDYIAIASSSGNELRILDPDDDLAVVSPGFVYALSVPTDPRPNLLASASLSDGGADVLVVASSGTAAGASSSGPVIQLVTTWKQEIVVAHRINLSTDLNLPAGSIASTDQVLALAGAPLMAPGSPPSKVSGSALILVAMTDGKIAAIQFDRQPDGLSVDVAAAQPAQVHAIDLPPLTSGGPPVSVNCVDLAVPLDNPDKYYCATGDQLEVNASGQPIYGAVEIDPLNNWSAVALNARDKTTSVAVVDNLLERLVSDPDVFDDSPDPTNPLKRRVYVTLDPWGCGMDRPIDCGVATLNPTNPTLATPGIVGDPLGEMPYRAPMAIVGAPSSIRAMGPPQGGGSLQLSYTTTSGTQPGLLIAPGSGQRSTPAVAAVGSSDGNVYILDLGRWQSPDDVSLLRGDTRTLVKNAVSSLPSGASGASLGLWTLDGSHVGTSATDLASAVIVTPGYTPTQSWRITWQGVLPGLQSRRGAIGRLDSATIYVAVQASSTDSSGAPTWVSVTRVDDGLLGIENGDYVELFPDTPTDCPTGTTLNVMGFIAPDSKLYPGGALELQAPVGGGCFGSLTAGDLKTVTLNVRASGVVLTGQSVDSAGKIVPALSIGYAGRPQINVQFTQYPPFVFQYPQTFNEDSSDLAKCLPGQWPPPSPVPACDDACRSACEQLALARKSRRHYYPSDVCTTTPCPDFLGFDPTKHGPVLQFTAGIVNGAIETLPRDAAITFDTQSGVQPMVRRPPTGGNLPTAITNFDRSTVSGKANDGNRFYVTFDDDVLIGFSPGQSSSSIITVR